MCPRPQVDDDQTIDLKTDVDLRYYYLRLATQACSIELGRHLNLVPHASFEVTGHLRRSDWDVMTIRKLDPEAREWSRRLRKEPETELDVAGLHTIEQQAIDTKYGFAAEHARRYISTNGEDDGWDGPGPILLLYCRGKKSGLWRRMPLMYFDWEGERHLIGSNGGGDAHSLWYQNIANDPHIYVRVMADFYEARAETLGNDERSRVWPHLIESYPIHATYQTLTERQIPLVRIQRLQTNP